MKLDHPSDVSTIKHRAASFGTPYMPSPDVEISIDPISLHYAIERETLRENVRKYIAHIEGIVGRAPEDVSGLKLTDFGASAEISIHHPVSEEFLERAVSQRHAHT